MQRPRDPLPGGGDRVDDLGASAAMKYDIEAWLPGQGRYRELTSTSNTTDYQARRLDIRYRPAEAAGRPAHVATLNGTAVAVGRTIIALLENGQQRGRLGALPALAGPRWRRCGAPAVPGAHAPRRRPLVRRSGLTERGWRRASGSRRTRHDLAAAQTGRSRPATRAVVLEHDQRGPRRPAGGDPGPHPDTEGVPGADEARGSSRPRGPAAAWAIAAAKPVRPWPSRRRPGPAARHRACRSRPPRSRPAALGLTGHAPGPAGASRRRGRRPDRSGPRPRASRAAARARTRCTPAPVGGGGSAAGRRCGAVAAEPTPS